LAGSRFPKVEAAGVISRWNQREINARSQTEDPISGQFEAAARRMIEELVVLLTSAPEFREDDIGVQEATHTFRPFL
jgi:hypothetical protein